MKKLFKSGLLSLIFLLFAASVWALPMAGDQVKMTVAPYLNYGMTVTTVGANSNSFVGDFYNAFCVEKNEFFSNGSIYTVDSVGDIAYNGGVGGHDVPGGDTVSNLSKWFYASFFEGVFGSISASLADTVQNAIWYEEGEITSNSDWTYLKTFANGDYSVNGWEFTVVNLVDANGVAQSQLVGAPVPEPATMLLFGFGLLGIAGVTRKKIS